MKMVLHVLIQMFLTITAPKLIHMFCSKGNIWVVVMLYMTWNAPLVWMIGNKSKISLSDTEQNQTSTTNLSWKKHKLKQRKMQIFQRCIQCLAGHMICICVIAIQSNQFRIVNHKCTYIISKNKYTNSINFLNS